LLCYPLFVARVFFVLYSSPVLTNPGVDLKALRKLGSVFLWTNKLLWTLLPRSLRHTRPGLAWGRFIFLLVNLKKDHIQLTTTYFFRNRAELDQFTDIACGLAESPKITVVGCSEGAEVFSILFSAQKVCPDIKINIAAFDIDQGALDIARQGRYQADSRLFKYTQDDEINRFFIRDGEWLVVKPELRAGIQWHLGDPTREPLYSSIPKQDILFINRLLFHMSREEAHRCLLAAASLIRPGGYLFVSGVDLDLRSQLARAGHWRPIMDRLEPIHAGDDTMTMDWPFERWGLEPLDRHHPDWPIRYCSVFQLPS